jgi:hypothetical protein
VLSFVSVDILTGKVLADLKDLTFGGALKDTMGRPETVSASLPVASAPVDWREATRPYSTAIVCLADDGIRPLWGAYVTNRKTNLGGSIQLSMSTVAEYFDRRFVYNETFTAVPQNTMVETLVNKYARDMLNGQPGIPIRVQVEGGTGVARTRTFANAEDKSLLSALQDLSGLDGGPEWVVEWENVNNLITPVLRVGTRIGEVAPAGLPGVEFTSPGCVRDAEYEESFKSGDGANDIMAFSSSQVTGAARPESLHYLALSDNRPRLEFRWSPSSSIKDTTTLNSHANRTLAVLGDGMASLTLTANRKEAPDLGSEWRTGDDVYVDLISPAWPNRLSGTARVIGWDLTEDTVTPIVLVNQSTVVWNI